MYYATSQRLYVQICGILHKKSYDADELINVLSYSVSQAWRTAHYSLMTKSRLF